MALRNISSTLIKTDLCSEENATVGAVFGLNTDRSLNRQLSFVYDIENRLTSVSNLSAGIIAPANE
jgi:hypothetical protein